MNKFHFILIGVFFSLFSCTPKTESPPAAAVVESAPAVAAPDTSQPSAEVKVTADAKDAFPEQTPEELLASCKKADPKATKEQLEGCVKYVLENKGK